MPENPYQPPKEVEKLTESPWVAIRGVSVAVAIVLGLTAVFLLYMFSVVFHAFSPHH